MSDDYLFYWRDRSPTTAEPLPALELWRPSWTSLKPAGLPGKRWLVWWLFDRALVFRRRWYAVAVVREGDEVVHHSVLFPRFFRFPTVGSNEVQIGDVWTRADARGSGLAQAAIRFLTEQADRRASGVWYITDSDNAASRAAAERCGFALRGRGKREPRLGLGVLGKYVLAEGLN